MLKRTLTFFTLPLLLLFGTSWENSEAQFSEKSPDGQTDTLKKMIVASGNVAMDLDLSRLKGISSGVEESKRDSVRFEVNPNSFFTILVFNDVLRALGPGSMALLGGNSTILPAPLGASSNRLVIESTAGSDEHELVVRDGETGFIFFSIQGPEYDYDANEQLLRIKEGTLLVTKEFATQLGFPAEAGSVVGKISITASMRAIEITQVVNGETTSAVVPAVGTRPGPDVIVGVLSGLAQFGSSGTQVGLAVGTDACNPGVVDLDWFANPSNNHPVIPQNLYRMSSGATNDERFEQIGQSSVKHAFTAASSNTCGFGCNGVGGTRLGSGCSDLYSAGLNAGPSLGSRAWINPFTGEFPRNDSPTPNNSHGAHTHTGTSHRILVEINDLNTTLNSGATYWAEGQYVTPHEYVWCQTHPGECNMNNNVSYRRYNVTGTTSFTFQTVTGHATVQEAAAIRAWTGATINQIEPAPGVDGIGLVGCKVTNPSAGIWHYEYAVYNQNIDRAIQSFSVPLGPGITVSNIGFHAPPQHPGWAADGTVGDAGYSSTPWTSVQDAAALSWSSETFAQNQNANAIRWGTLYNFRFDSNRPPQAANATIGFFKTGTPITIGIQGPSPDGGATPTPTPATPTPTPATPTPTPATPTPPPTTPTPPPATPTPTATPTPFTVDLALTKSDSPDPVQAGSNLTYTITISNLSPRAAFNAIMTDTLPAGVTFVSATPSQGFCTGASTVTCHLDSIVGQTTATVTLVVTPTAAGTLSNTATVSTTSQEFNLSNNSDTEMTTVNPASTPTPPPATPTPTPATPTPPPATPTPPPATPTPPPATPTPPAATPTPTPIPASQAINLSTRMFIQTGDNVGVGGFIITGSVPKHVLIRAIGPSLTGVGVSNALADPILELHGPESFVTTTDNNWQDDPIQKALIEATGIPPTHNLEAAIEARLAPGAYTAVVRGNNNGTGVGLIEIYDLNPGAGSRLGNISTRAFVSTGDNIVIAGFMLGANSAPDRVIVRGIGPSLAALGVPNALANPTLELRDGNGAMVMENNDWQDNAAQAVELSAAGLAPTSPLESGIAATLPPGLYTALLAGQNNGAGVGLVEVYDRGP
ncbi:MAG TPA: DUF11 domain-containing protein [Chthoniobacterales bacterium]|nr:DUF11 domain-containing protein [Chthoniobacterales bacterium]